jgi:hypothetical protein
MRNWVASAIIRPLRWTRTNLEPIRCPLEPRSDGPQYITSNTLDEVSHATFLNAYLESRGAEPVNFDKFRTLEGSTATGSSGIKRLTNLMHLNVDTSWYVRYRSATNPDFGATFPQAITLNERYRHSQNDADFGTIDPSFKAFRATRIFRRSRM